MKLRTLIAFIAPLLLSVSAHAADAALAVSADVPDVVQLLVNGKKGVPASITMINDPATGLQAAEIPIQIRTNNLDKKFYIYLYEYPSLTSDASVSIPLSVTFLHTGAGVESPLGDKPRTIWSASVFPNGKSSALASDGLATSNVEPFKIRQQTPGPLKAGTYTGTIKLVLAIKP